MILSLYFFLVAPKGKPILNAKRKSTQKRRDNSPLIIAVEENVTFTCLYEKESFESNPPVSNYSFFNNGTLKANETNNQWEPELNRVTDSGSYRCTANNTEGGSVRSDPLEVLVQGESMALLQVLNKTFTVVVLELN